MPRITVGRNSRLAALLVAAILGLAFAAVASADTPPGRGPSGGPAPTPTPPAGDCAVLRVKLNGTQPATQTCLATAPAVPGTGVPTAESVNDTYYCLQGDLHLYLETNYGGKYICFYGEGSANLTQYVYQPWSWINYVRDWNDKVSSFKTGSSFVNFYEDTFLHGEKLRYASYQWRASMPSGWNDRISSLCLWGPTVSCP